MISLFPVSPHFCLWLACDCGCGAVVCGGLACWFVASAIGKGGRIVPPE